MRLEVARYLSVSYSIFFAILRISSGIPNPRCIRQLVTHTRLISHFVRQSRMSTADFGTCRMSDTSQKSIAIAAEQIRNGGLVAFPTETVYGLGANALDVDAVLSIFRAKGRPLTDPLIVHVTSMEMALEFVTLPPEGSGKAVLIALGTAFWPGPLTIIAKAAECIPSAVTANTGFVGLRVPQHPLAMGLIAACGLPIAAPSANRFGHVSPTKAEHVRADFLQHGAEGREIIILDGESTDSSTVSGIQTTMSGSCAVGIESTVVKILSDSKKIQILRQGAVVKSQLEAVLRQQSLDYTVEVVVRAVKMESATSASSMQVQSSEGLGAQEEPGQQAPGQAITHYAPDIPCLIARSVRVILGSVDLTGDSATRATGATCRGEELVITASDLRRVVVIDFGGQFARLGVGLGTTLGEVYQSLGYRDLSPVGDAAEAARSLFDTLRWAELLDDGRASLVLLPHITCSYFDELIGASDARVHEVAGEEEAISVASSSLVPGLADRMFRAASGRLLNVVIRSK